MKGAPLFSILVASTVAAFSAGCSTVQSVRYDPAVGALATNRLRTFRDMAEFEAYRDSVRALGKKHNVWWSHVGPQRSDRILLAQSDPQPCDPATMDCEPAKAQEVVMTAQRVSPRRTSITHNQEVDVDEGDIVKQYSHFLIVLQHGRLFSIDIGSREADLQLVDRINLYSSPKDDTWYDELLIHGSDLVVTGYSYKESATEINVLSISESGELDLRARYFLQSDDYYSGSNYASRLVRGQFVIYTPVSISGKEPLSVPRIRSWTAAAGLSDWMPLFDITDVYLPIQKTLTPAMHIVSICSVDGREEFGCKSRGVVGSAYREMYVSAENIYLWLSSDYQDWTDEEIDSCPSGADMYAYSPLRAAVFQMPLRADGVRALHTIGLPHDQFAFDERDEKLLALLERPPQDCYPEDAPPLIFASIPLGAFSASPGTFRADRFTRVPNTDDWRLQNRFTTNYLVYASEQGYWRYDDDADRPVAKIVVVPIDDPADFRELHPSHSVERLEVIGDNAVSFGVSGDRDWGVSTVDLRTTPHIANTSVLADLVETEGRSHAFNALVEFDGSGTFGLPTVYRSKLETDWSLPSDVQFFTIDRQLWITPVGELAGQDDEDESYECEVSCYDWYGNARPIFIDLRIFALTGSELIEGEIRSGTMAETGRLRMTGTPRRQRE